MLEDNILLITDNDNVTETVLSKLSLLRGSDNVAVCNYNNAVELLNNSNISVVIVHERNSETETLEFLKTVISQNYDVILLFNEYKQQLILKAYDLGIQDYFAVTSPYYEILIKIVNVFKHRTLNAKYSRNTELLQHLGAIDTNTGFYKYKFCKDLFAEFVKDIKFRNGMFLVLSVDDDSKKILKSDVLSCAIKDVIRGDDIISVVQSSKFYILLPNTDKNGAYALVDKIQDILLSKGIIIRAGICKINATQLPELERKAFSALIEAVNKNETSVYLPDENKLSNDWLEPDENDEKRYKLFNKTYITKLEKIITPVFFRLQKVYENKLFNTEINQYTEYTQSVFFLKDDTHESKLKIIYPGFAKIIIQTEHSGLDTPENNEYYINLNEITQTKLTQIMENFITEFKKFIKK